MNPAGRADLRDVPAAAAAAERGPGCPGSTLSFSRDQGAEMAVRQCRLGLAFSFLTCMLSVIAIMEMDQIVDR